MHAEARAEMVSGLCGECGADVSFVAGRSQTACAHCGAGLAVDGQSLVRLSCPVCGGNFCYIDGALCGTCPYCTTPLLALGERKVLRYVVSPRVAAPTAGARLLLLPFWRLRGLCYGWVFGRRQGSELPSISDAYAAMRDAVGQQDDGAKAFVGRVATLSLPDAATWAHGMTSLRTRACVFPLEPLQPHHETLGALVPPHSTAEQAREQLTAMALDADFFRGPMLRADCQRVDLVASTLSVVFYPLWVDDSSGQRLGWDAVNGEPEPLAPLGAMPAPTAPSLFAQLRVIELVCQDCKTPLPRGQRPIVFPCQECGRFWFVDGDRLVPFSASYALGPSVEEELKQRPDLGLLWLPFWRVRVVILCDGRQADTVGSLSATLGGMQQVRGGDAQQPLSYFVPAYGSMQAPRLDHAARDLTMMQPALAEAGASTSGRALSCFLGPDDAKELAYAVWIQFLPAMVRLRKVQSLRVYPTETQLWYVPFADAGRELLNLVTHRRYDRRTFRGLAVG